MELHKRIDKLIDEQQKLIQEHEREIQRIARRWEGLRIRSGLYLFDEPVTFDILDGGKSGERGVPDAGIEELPFGEKREAHRDEPFPQMRRQEII